MTNRDELLRRQKALADFGEFVLDCEDLDSVLNEGCRLIAEAMRTDLAKVIEIDRASGTGLVRAGVGWNAGVVGRARFDLTERSSEAYAIEKSEPVITKDISKEDRFHFPDFMRDHDIVAIVNVPIMLPGRRPYGVLQVDAREPREFDDDDIQFLKTYAMVLGPVVDRLRAVSNLRRTDSRLQLIVENARSYAIILSDAEDRITDWLAGSEEIFGWTAQEAHGQETRILFTDEDRAAGIPERELAGARAGGASANVRWHKRKDGRLVFLDGQTIALREPNHELRGYLKIGQDVTDRKRHEERQGVLLAELQHRVRNVLAMVRALIRRSVAGAETVQQLTDRLEGRIDALARTQALLTRALGTGVDLENLIREELIAQAADDGQIEVSGPTVQLSPKAAEVLTLAIHELATNAVKYGAIGQSQAQLKVVWRTQQRDSELWLCLTWDETGVEMPPGNGGKPGFGTELITRRVPYELSGRGAVDLHETGVRCTIEFPLVHGESVFDPSSPSGD